MPKVICKLLAHDQQTFSTDPNLNPHRPAGSEWINLGNAIERDEYYSKYFLIKDTLVGTTQGTITARTFVSNYFIAKKNIYNIPSWVSSEEASGNLRIKLYVKLFQNNTDQDLKVGFKSIQAIYKQNNNIIYGRERTYLDEPYQSSLKKFPINNSTVWEFDGNGKLWTDGFTEITAENINDDEFGFKIQLVFTWGMESAVGEANDGDIQETNSFNSDFGIEWVQVEFEWNNVQSKIETKFTQVETLSRGTEFQFLLQNNPATERRAVKKPNWQWDVSQFNPNSSSNSRLNWKPTNNQLNYVIWDRNQNRSGWDTHLESINLNGNISDGGGIGRSFFFSDFLILSNLSPKIPNDIKIDGIILQLWKQSSVQNFIDNRITARRSPTITNTTLIDSQTYPGYHTWDETVQFYLKDVGEISSNHAWKQEGFNPPTGTSLDPQYNRTRVQGFWPYVFPTSEQATSPTSFRGYTLTAASDQEDSNGRYYGGTMVKWDISNLTSTLVNDNKFGLKLSMIYAHNWLNRTWVGRAAPAFSDANNINFNNFFMGYDKHLVTIYYADPSKAYEDFISWGTYFQNQEFIGYNELKLSIVRNLAGFPSISTLEAIGGLRVVNEKVINHVSLASYELIQNSKITDQKFINNEKINGLELISNNLNFDFKNFIHDSKIESEENISADINVKTSVSISPKSIQSEENITKKKLDYPFDQTITMSYPIRTTEKLSNHEILKLIFDPVFYTKIFNPSYETGYFDILALSQDENTEPFYNLNFSSLDENFLFTANNINLNYEQSSLMNKRLAGEGANPNTFKINTRNLSLEFSIPVRVESYGYVDTTFAAIYDYFIQGYKGNKNSFVSRFSNEMPSVITSTSTLIIDNISDFLPLGNNFSAYIKSDDGTEPSETITVVSVNKNTRTLTLSSPTIHTRNRDNNYIWAKPSNPVSNRESSFSLFSLREGLLSGCMVDSITLNIVPGQTLDAKVSVKFTNLDRKYQKNMLSDFENIVQYVNSRKPNYLINGSQVTIKNTIPDQKYFGLGTPITNPIFHGFQDEIIQNYEINEITLVFKNDLQPIYSLNSKTNDTKINFKKNLEPYAYYSNGRSISGTIKYSSPIKPMLFAEKIAGSSSLNNGGLILNFGSFTLTLPDIVWTPENSTSTMDQVHQKSVSFSVASKKLNFDPYFISTGTL